MPAGRCTFIVVGGGGMMARAIVSDFARFGARSSANRRRAAPPRVLVADADIHAAREAAHRFGDAGTRAVRIDVHDVSQAIRFFRGADIVINAAPYMLNLAVMEAAREAGVHYLDLGGLFFVTRQQLLQHRAFERAGLTALVGAGGDPGVTNVLARRAADRLDRVERIRIFDGSIDRTRYRSPLPFGFAPATVFDELTTPAMIYSRGAFRSVPLGSGEELVHFPPPVGVQAVRASLHSEVATLPLSFRHKGVREVSFKIHYDEPFVHRVRLLAGLGLTDTRRIEIAGRRLAPRQMLLAVLKAQPPETARPNDYNILRVVVEGRGRGRRVRHTLDAAAGAAPARRLSAVAVITGFPAAILARMIADGRIGARGVVPPEVAVPAEEFIRELKRRAIRVRERREWI